ncbi:BlaI/MecI/CopY family transcriptional regulator [bacterium]|nr:BlaI/MecI/CopY family transcriptional regulator [bacterium]
MAKSKKPKPTEAEMAILHVLWDQGSSTVRQILEQLQDQRGTGYTTTLKLMQIMHEKGLLRRDESGHAHIYTAAVTRQRTQRQMVKQLLDQAFDGSAQQLVMQALSAKKSTPSELAEIRTLLDELERKSS